MEDKKKHSKHYYEKLNFENFSNLLLETKIISSNLSNEQKMCINYPKIDTEAKKVDNLELTLSDEERDNSKNKIKTKICEFNIDINNIYNLFTDKIYQKENFNTMIKVFISIFNNFNDLVFKFDLNKNEIFSFENKIQIIKLNDRNSKISYESYIQNLYEKLESMNEEYDIQIINIFFLINIFTLFGKLTYNDFSLDSILMNLNEYTSIIINDIKLSLFIHFHVILTFNLALKKLSVENFLDNKKDKKSFFNFPNKFYPTIYFLNSNLKNDEFSNKNTQLILLLNSFKFYLLPYIISNLKIAINLKVISYESLEWVFSILNFNSKSKNNIFNLEKENLFDDIQFNSLINNNFYINSFSIDLNPNFRQKDIEDLFKKYNNLIVSSIYFSADSLKYEDKNIEYPLIRYLEEINLLIWTLKYNLKLKKKKKNKDSKLNKNYYFTFTFNSFSIATKKDVSSKDSKDHLRDILIFIHNNHYSEVELLLYLSQNEKLINYYNLIIDIIKEFSFYKKYSIGIRLCSNEIKDFELKYYLSIIYLQIQYYIQEHNTIYKNVVLYEEKVISNNFAIILIKNIKVKEHKIFFEKCLKKINQQKINLLYQFYKELFEYFSETLIIDQTKNFTKFDPYTLLSYYNNNKCIIVYNKYEVMDIFIYINEKSKDDLLYLDKIIDLILELIKSDFIRVITLIMNFDGIQKSNYWKNNKKLFNDKVCIYIINNKKISCIFDKKNIILNYEDDENKNNKYELFCKMISIYFEPIKYIISTKKLKYYDSLSIIYKKKIYQYKEGNFRIKKISDKPKNKLFITEVLKGDKSYPLFVFMLRKDITNINLEYILFNFENIVYKTQNFTNNNIMKFIKSFIEKSLKFYYPLVTNEKYFRYIDNFFTNNFPNISNKIFDNEVIFHLDLSQVLFEINSLISKKITIFEVVNTKLNFYTINDIGKIFGFKKITLSLEELINSSKLKLNENKNNNTNNNENNNENNNIDVNININNNINEKNNINNIEVYEINFEDFANIVRKYKKKVKFIGFSDNQIGKVGFPKRKKEKEKCDIF